MSDLDKAITALKNAHDAGDTAAAEKIATAIKGMQVPAPREKVSNIGGMSAMATQGYLAGAGDEYLAGLSAVLGVQPDGQGGADWFQYEKPFRERYGTALSAIRSEMGEYRDENPGKALAAQVGGGIAGAVTAGKVLKGRGLLPAPAVTTAGKVGQIAAGGGIGAGIEGFNSGEGGFKNRATSAAISAPIGAVFAPIVGFGVAKIGNVAERIGGKALRAVFKSRRLFDPETGRLTDKGRDRLKALGYDATALSREMEQAFGVASEKVAQTVDEPLQGAAIGRVAAAERFGVPLTRGQATGEVAQTAAEEGMRAGVRGASASQVIGAFDETQRGAVQSARNNIGQAFTEGASDRIDAAEGVISGVRREAEAARKAGSAAYDALGEANAAVSGSQFNQLGRRISQAVRDEGFAIDSGTPNAQSAVSLLKTTFAKAKKGAVPFNDIERARQRMVGLRKAAYAGSNGADQVAMDSTIRQFDDWLDETITEALIQGDDGVLDQAKNARQLWGKYRSTFLGREGADNFVRKIVEDDLAPDQVAGWLFGASNKMGGGQSSLVAKRVKNILGDSSPEWQSVKRAAWDHMTTAPEGAAPYGPQRVASNITELISGKGKTLGRELYSEAELRQLGEFRDMLKILIPPEKATNRSGSGYEVQRGMQNLLAGMAGMMGTAGGGPVTGAATTGAVKFTGNLRGALAARAAAKGLVLPGASAPVAIGAGVAAGAAAQERTIR